MAAPRTRKLSSNVHLSILLLLLFSVKCSHASDSLFPNQTLSGSQVLVSERGRFTLGFFQPGRSPYYYIGIWYSLPMFSDLVPVWVANREVPIVKQWEAKFRISANGNLVLSDPSNPNIWSTSATTTSSSSFAILLDSGNLVLCDGNKHNSTLWQSFDHPTHTWLPGASLGFNKATGEVRRLTSWKAEDDPAPGRFSLELEPNDPAPGRFFLLSNNSISYWTSGSWNGKTFSLVPALDAIGQSNLYFVLNDNENYLAYNATNGEDNLPVRFTVSQWGQFMQWVWVESSNSWVLMWSLPRLQCEVHALCGPFGSCKENALPLCNCIEGFHENSPSDWAVSDWAGGCVRSSPLHCGANISTDAFYVMPDMRLPDSSQSLQVGSATECKSGCLSNCSCTAYSFGSNGCFIWHGGLLNLQDQYNGSDGGTVLIRVPASEFPHNKDRKEVVIIGVAIGSVAVLLAVLAIVFWLIKRRRRGMGRSNSMGCGLVSYKYSDLQSMTKNFSEKLGGGGFGSVFRGALPDSTSIAVKKLEGFKQGEKQFWSEVRTIGTTQHVNLVRLHGFCCEGKERLLVYEYMPNGSLDAFLFQKGSTKVIIDWKTRYQIALGTAQGLTYLHEHCRHAIIHCDIKPENILLDASLVPKVADFGLAKLLGRDFSRILTTMRGTIGYLAPEWISGLAITAKADVYSYGMMLFEIISGKRNLNLMEDENAGFFPAQAATKLIEGDVIGLLDSQIVSDADVEEVTRVCKVACWCIQDHVNSRPTMRQVVQMLEGIIEVDTPPVPRILQILSNNSGSVVPFFELSPNPDLDMIVVPSFSERETHLDGATV